MSAIPTFRPGDNFIDYLHRKDRVPGILGPEARVFKDSSRSAVQDLLRALSDYTDTVGDGLQAREGKLNLVRTFFRTAFELMNLDVLKSLKGQLINICQKRTEVEEPVIGAESARQLATILCGQTKLQDLKVEGDSGSYVASFTVSCDGEYKFKIEYRIPSISCDKAEDITIGKISTFVGDKELEACCGRTENLRLIGVIQKLLHKNLS